MGVFVRFRAPLLRHELTKKCTVFINLEDWFSVSINISCLIKLFLYVIYLTIIINLLFPNIVLRTGFFAHLI
jgi:hypothetical protein